MYQLYTAPLEAIINKYGLSFHIYADDTQIYISISNETNSIETLEMCLDEIKDWMVCNKLKLNESKTEILKISPKRSKSKLNVDHLNIAGKAVTLPTSDCIRNLGCYFDSHMTMEMNISKICQACHFHLRNIGKIRDCLDNDTTHLLVHSFITSRLDYCNSLLSGVPDYLIQRLQKIQNKAARLVLRKGKEVSTKSILKEFHWLPIQQRIVYKIALQIFKCLSNMAPAYLCELIKEYSPTRELRSSSLKLVTCPRTNSIFEERAFSIAGPKIWNNLSLKTRSSNSIGTFKKNLKTELFNKTYQY